MSYPQHVSPDDPYLVDGPDLCDRCECPECDGQCDGDEPATPEEAEQSACVPV